MRRFRSRLSSLVPLGAAALVATVADNARAQSGVVNKPIPNVLLLIDTSGSMERMPDNSLPSANRNPVDGTTLVPGPATLGNACTPGTETNPNRWGMLLQALTGSMQPYYSCGLMPRTANGALYNEFKINNQAPYDTDYALPYHRPLTGNSNANACAWAPHRLPGGGGVGPTNLASGGDAGDFPADAFQSARFQHLMLQYAANSGLSMPANQCNYDQAPDGQLDISRDFVRFSLMTFDSDTDPGTGVTTVIPPPTGGNTGANPFLGQWSYVASPPMLAVGRPTGCATSSPLEVGARHWAAPPWEGRMVLFPEPQGSIFDVRRTNEEIQRVLLGTRPWGATPIDGLIGDAQDYLWRHTYGPNQTQPGFEDPYVKGGCRDQYIILLTDGAPNLNLRPQCEVPGVPAGQCPYPRSRDMVYDMVRGLGGPAVTTYVIGFSVNGSGQFTGDGFPTGSPYETAPLNNCKDWYFGAAPQGGGGTPQGMDAACSAARGAGRAQPGSTADACCQLNEIAYFGSGGPASPTTATGAFFAETQADLVRAFGRILGNVAKTVATRTVPGYSPAITNGSGSPVSGRFNAAFIPNAQRVWSGEIARTRSVCAGPTPTDVTISQADGDSYATNVAAQAGDGSRFFISVVGDATGVGGIDSLATMRPFTAATPGYDDLIAAYSGTEVGGLGMALTGTANFAQAMGIDDNTCKRSKAPAALGVSGAITIPRLLQDDCRDVIWGFTVSNPAAMFMGTPHNFNVRCKNAAGGLTAGRCSISSNACTVGGAPCAAGETCVPDCAALGAIFRASPTIVGPPNAFLREEAYRGFVDGRALRRPTMFAATTDGILHAFKALENSPNGGAAPAANWEMWNFIPPAVLPRLASNYPSGTQVLLDGTPVVKDMVWDRSAITDRSQWHTTLVAGLGQGGGGYYALNVSDADCGGVAPTLGNGCNPGGWTAASNVLATASAGGGLDAGARRGPHFLWQLTDIQKMPGPAENAKVTRRAPDNLERVALFGSQTGTPALATLQVNPDSLGTRQIGVAILPGGIDGPPVRNQACNRAINGGAMGAYAAGDYDRSDPANPPRTAVRRWGANCNSAVPGRGVTIVRADTGEIIRHFGRRAQDVPQRIWDKTTDTAFDSPMVGIPVVYPNAVGSITQRIYVGDADGTMWMIDVSRPDPSMWRAYLMQDLIRTNGLADSQPISIAPVITLDPTGTLNINVATGDLENIVSSTIPNYVYSIREEAPNSGNGFLPRSNVRWFLTLPNGERVTGPMVVFDRSLYFSTHVPEALGLICSGSARSRLWGVDFILQATPGTPAGGPVPRWCPIGTTDPATGVCNAGAYTLFENIPSAANVILPGVSLRANLPCATFGAVSDDPTGGIVGLTPGPTHFLEVPIPGGGSAGGGALVPPSLSLARAPASTPSSIDAWAIVTD